MKKVSIIILLTALILGAFTACNGDVFSELMPKPKRVITLEIPSIWEDVSFDNTEDVKTKELEIPEDCETWADYLTKVTGIKVYYVDPLEEYTLRVVDNKVYFGDIHGYGLKLDDSKVVPELETVEASATIEIGGTYTLTHELN